MKSHKALIKITDFGIAEKKPTLARGSATYSSPELAVAREKHAKKLVNFDCKASDIYSLGVVYTELLTTKLPLEFEDKSLNKEFKEEQNNPEFQNTVWKMKAEGKGFKLPTQLESEERLLLGKMLNNDVRSRPSIEQILKSKLFHSLATVVDKKRPREEDETPEVSEKQKTARIQ